MPAVVLLIGELLCASGLASRLRLNCGGGRPLMGGNAGVFAMATLIDT
jgi:hypothetical protein